MITPLPQVSFRAMEPEDLDNLYSIENDTSIWNAGTTSVPYSRYTLYQYIANAKNDIFEDRQVRLMIEDESKDVVGIIDIYDYDPKHHRAEVGIVIKREYRGQGYARSAIKRITNYALDVLHLHQLYAYIDKTNKVSRHVFEQSGFTLSAELKDWLFDGRAYHDALLMQIIL